MSDLQANTSLRIDCLPVMPSEKSNQQKRYPMRTDFPVHEFFSTEVLDATALRKAVTSERTWWRLPPPCRINKP